MSAVAPTPVPSRFLSETAEYTPSLYPVPDVNSSGSSFDIPTSTVIVVAPKDKYFEKHFRICRR